MAIQRQITGWWYCLTLSCLLSMDHAVTGQLGGPSLSRYRRLDNDDTNPTSPTNAGPSTVPAPDSINSSPSPFASIAENFDFTSLGIALGPLFTVLDNFGPTFGDFFRDPTPPPEEPTLVPTSSPTSVPTTLPTQNPTLRPTPSPTRIPTRRPTPSPTTAEQVRVALQERIANTFALQGGAEFEDDTSYQSRALQKTARIPNILDLEDAMVARFYSLYCIYEATNGVSNWVIENDPRFNGRPIPTWLSSDGWDGQGANWTEPCTWYGVGCNLRKKVTSLKLFRNRLTGDFPPEVVLLARDGDYDTGAGGLRVIDLFGNEFLSNNRDNSWWQHLGIKLVELLFRETSFGGELGRLPPNIVEFDCSYTLMSGGLTDDIFEDLESLAYVVLDGNFFNSSIPSAIGRLPNLENLYASDAAIQGDLSYLNGGLPQIVEHWLDFNPDVTGTIPSSVGALTTLASLSLTKNGLTGPVPTELGELMEMRQLWLSGNSLSGEIPTELGLLKRLRLLQVEDNDLVGRMPSEVCANKGGVFSLKTVGADCDDDNNFVCDCCTCCSYEECNP